MLVCPLKVACGEQHNVARALPKESSPFSGDGANAELYVWGGGQLGQVRVRSTATKVNSGDLRIDPRDP